MLFGNKTPTDANEAITFATGGKFTSTVNSDGSIDFTATSTTVGDSDTATLTDDSETINVTLVVAADTATGIEEEGVTYVPAGSPVTAPSA